MTRQAARAWTKADRRDLWRRWHQGESLPSIARALERNKQTVREFFLPFGGIERVQRKRREGSLSLEEREEISRGIVRGLVYAAIARELGRAPSTISREIARNGGRDSYRAAKAQERALERARRPKERKLARGPKLRRLVASKLREHWSPAQIAGWLKAKFTTASRLYVSHETIYRTLFIQAKGALKKELIAHLRSNRVMRRAKSASLRGKGRGQIVDAVSISERPAEADDRAVPGHWEGNLLLGAHKHAVATLVERSQARRPRRPLRDQGPDQADHEAARTPSTLAHLGPRPRARRARQSHRRHGRPGLLLRSTKPMAARHEREHQPAAAPVPTQGRSARRLLAKPAQRHRPQAQRASAKDVELRDAS